MRALLVTVIVVLSTGRARAETSISATTTEHRLGLAMRHAWGAADAYELAARYEHESETEWSNYLLGLELGGGEVGGRGTLTVGATADMLALHTAGLGFGLHFLRASDDGARYLGRVSVGLRLHGVELGYAYQRPLAGNGEDWMASHLFVIGLRVPLKFDY